MRHLVRSAAEGNRPPRRLKDEPMPKFIVIDPSVQGYQGHFYEYAFRVLQAARRQGYETHLASHRRFQVPKEFPGKVHRLYRCAFWPTQRERTGILWLKRLGTALAGVVGGLLLKAYISRFGLLLESLRYYARHPRHLARRLPFPYGLLLLVPLVPLAVLLWPLWWLVRRVLRFFRALIGPVVRIARKLYAHRRELLITFWADRKLRDLERGTRRLLRRVSLEPGDVVFLSLVSEAELLGLLRLFRRCPQARNATWHLMFRHQIYRPDQWHSPGEEHRLLRSALYQLIQEAAPGRVFLHADTEDLARQYETLGVGPVAELPIPVPREYHQQRRQEATLPYRIAYVGDARAQKGYHLLPRLVEDLWPEVEQGRVVFHFQSNFNVPLGSPETDVARWQLLAQPRRLVQLELKPLDSERYRRMIVESDLLLVPYEPVAYYAGSSGIFAEALAAGVPVVCPATTWMARQLAPVQQAYLEHLWPTLENAGTAPAHQWHWQAERPPLSEQGYLWLAPGKVHQATLRCPENVSLLGLSVGRMEPRRSDPVLVQVRQLDQFGACLAQQTAVLHALEGTQRALVPIHDRAQEVQLQWRPAGPWSPMRLHGVECHWFSPSGPQQVPISAVGVVYADTDEELTGAVREVIQHMEHYKQTALAFSEQWAAYHNADTLVETLHRLVQAEPQAPATTETPGGTPRQRGAAVPRAA